MGAVTALREVERFIEEFLSVLPVLWLPAAKREQGQGAGTRSDAAAPLTFLSTNFGNLFKKCRNETGCSAPGSCQQIIGLNENSY